MDADLFGALPGGGATVVGLIGDPVAHSLSPAMHNSAFRYLGLDWIYAPFAVKGGTLQQALRGLKALGVRGVNVTIPHKEAVMPFLDELTEAARAAGAVNTIVHEDGRLIGDNTDGIGFVRALHEETGFDPVGARVLVYGAGGAAKAIAAALAEAGAGRLDIVNRTIQRAERLALKMTRADVHCAAYGLDEPSLADVVKAAELIVQTTPAGMTGGEDESTATLPPPLQADWLHEGQVVADIVYTPLETPLVQAAVRQGCTVAPGWGMLLYQGAESFSRWTGTEAPVAIMRGALLRGLGKGQHVPTQR